MSELHRFLLQIYSDHQFRFSDLENIIATRISLLHSALQREQRDQIGDMQSDLTRVLLQVERRCLLQLSEASREANQAQVALNSILRALRLDEAPAFEIQQEFANVLWLQHERKYAVDCLREEVQRQRRGTSREDDDRKVQDALALAKLVSQSIPIFLGLANLFPGCF